MLRFPKAFKNDGWIGEGWLEPETPKDAMDGGVHDSKKGDGSDGCDSLDGLGDYFINIERVPYMSQPSSPCLPQPQGGYINETGTCDDSSSFSFDNLRTYDNVLPENILADSLSPFQLSPSDVAEAGDSHKDAFGISIPELNTSFSASVDLACDNTVFSDINHYLLHPEDFSSSEPFLDDGPDSSSSASLAATSQQTGVLPSASPSQQSTSSLRYLEEAAKKQPKSKPKRKPSNCSQPCPSKTPAKKRGPGRPRSTLKTIVPQEHDYSRQPLKRKVEKNSGGAMKKTKLSREQHNENERRRRAEQKKHLEDMQSALRKLNLDSGDKKLHHNNSLNLAAETVSALMKEGEILDNQIKEAFARRAVLLDFLKST